MMAAGRGCRGTMAGVGGILLAAGIWLGCASDAAAQVARYQPRRPTVSPYLNLSATNFGVLPNYFALVRPQIQQQQFNLQEQALRQTQQREIVRLQNQVQRGSTPAGATGTGSWFMAPGQRVRFQDTSQFFPEPPFRGIRR